MKLSVHLVIMRIIEKCLLFEDFKKKDNRETGVNPVRLGRCNEGRMLSHL